jgi:hypothetical protein
MPDPEVLQSSRPGVALIKAASSYRSALLEDDETRRRQEFCERFTTASREERYNSYHGRKR